MQTQNTATGQWVIADVWCPTAATPTPDPDTLRQQALRLVPALPVQISPPDNGLVNLENILSNPTTMTRQVAPATVLGQTVHLRLKFHHATWTYGDDSDSETTRDPGQPYDQIHHPCGTLKCPDYFGHTYTRPGTYTLTTTITWIVDYTLDNATWSTLGQLDGPTTKHTTHIRAAHAQLVP
ncbi:MAG: hypothetical protein JWN95_3889 [Frankiales bacterium]|nr:hypothetical protein [Frankiales bacterium]